MPNFRDWDGNSLHSYTELQLLAAPHVPSQLFLLLEVEQQQVKLLGKLFSFAFWDLTANSPHVTLLR